MGMDFEEGKIYSAEQVGTDFLLKQKMDVLNRLVTFKTGEIIEIKGGRFRLISIDANLGQIKLLLLPKDERKEGATPLTGENFPPKEEANNF